MKELLNELNELYKINTNKSIEKFINQRKKHYKSRGTLKKKCEMELFLDYDKHWRKI